MQQFQEYNNMSLIQSNETLTPAQQEAINIRNNALRSFNDLKAMQLSPINVMWRNNKKLTPQEICDALGTDAAVAFISHGKLTNFLVELAATLGINYTPALPTKNFTINQDGTVTILDELFSF